MLRNNLSMTRFLVFCIVFLMVHSLTFAQGIFDQTADWELSQDNNIKVPGSAQFENGTYVIEGNGNDIWNQEDEGFYLYTHHPGDTTLQARVNWIDTAGHDWSKTGLMIRDNAQSPSSKHYSFLMRGSQNGDRSMISWRSENEGSSALSFVQDSEGNNVGNKDGNGLWMRLSYYESKELCVASYSLDGNKWIEYHQLEMKMEAPVAYGLVVTNHMDNESLASAMFDHVELQQAETPTDRPTPLPTDTPTPSPLATNTPTNTPTAVSSPTPESPVHTPTPIPGWFILDGYGGIHTTNPEAQKPMLPYFGFNIIRDLEPDPLGRGWYMLDGFGGIHTSSPELPKPDGLPYFSFDIARNLEIKQNDDGLQFYLLDGYGAIHTTVENFKFEQLPWFGFDNVRDLEPDDEQGWWVLDRFGIIHHSSGEYDTPLSGASEFMPVAKSIVRFEDETMVMLDGYGGRYTKPSNPAQDLVDGLPEGFYFPGFDILWDLEVTAD